jgi:hypothetical protein
MSGPQLSRVALRMRITKENGFNSIFLQKIRKCVNSIYEQSCPPIRRDRSLIPPTLPPPRAKARERFLSAKIPRNPLKRFDSDERIQGNPSFSNPSF